MKKETLISILVFVFIIIVVYVLAYYLYFTFPTKIEVERYFEENKCVYCSGEAYGEVYQMRRQTAMLWGQIFRIPSWWMPPNFILYTTTPFNYYHEMTHGEDEFHTYTWVDTREGRFVYNAVSGEYVKEIDDKKDPMKKYLHSLRSN